MPFYREPCVSSPKLSKASIHLPFIKVMFMNKSQNFQLSLGCSQDICRQNSTDSSRNLCNTEVGTDVFPGVANHRILYQCEGFSLCLHCDWCSCFNRGGYTWWRNSTSSFPYAFMIPSCQNGNSTESTLLTDKRGWRAKIFSKISLKTQLWYLIIAATSLTIFVFKILVDN